MTVIDLFTRCAVAGEAEPIQETKPQYSERELERFRRLRDAIEAEADAMDKDWLESYVDEYRETIDDDDVLRDFVENYSSRSIGVVRFDHLSAEEIKAAVPADLLLAKIQEHSELEPCDDFYTQWNEMGSVQIGEHEHQIDVSDNVPAIAVELANMTDADLERFNKWAYAYVRRGSFCVFGRPCERLVLKLDYKAFLKDKAIKASLALTYGKTKRTRGASHG